MFEKGNSQGKLERVLSIFLLISIVSSIAYDIAGIYNDSVANEVRISGCEANADPEEHCFRFYYMKRETDNLFRLGMFASAVPLLILVFRKKAATIQFLLLSLILFAFLLWFVRILMVISANWQVQSELFWTAFDTNPIDFLTLALALSLSAVKLRYSFRRSN